MEENYVKGLSSIHKSERVLQKVFRTETALSSSGSNPPSIKLGGTQHRRRKWKTRERSTTILQNCLRFNKRVPSNSHLIPKRNNRTLSIIRCSWRDALLAIVSYKSPIKGLSRLLTESCSTGCINTLQFDR